jgi:hypothetical protein
VQRSLTAGAGQRPARLLAGTALVTKLIDGTENLIGWTASPMYVTVHLVPAVAGFLLADLVSHL